MKYLLKAPGSHIKNIIKYPEAKNEISFESEEDWL